MTAVIVGVTALVGAAQLASPAVIRTLQLDPAKLKAGEWWRAVTPMLVQPSGYGQYIFNLVGAAVVGRVVERAFGPGRWLALYLAGGLAGVAANAIWFPLQTNGGSSDAVAALIGALALTAWSSKQVPSWPSSGYACFFTAYLAGLAGGGVAVSIATGDSAVIVMAILRRSCRPATQLRFLLLLVVVGAIFLTALRDDHGVGLLVGVVAGAALNRWPFTPKSVAESFETHPSPQGPLCDI